MGCAGSSAAGAKDGAYNEDTNESTTDDKPKPPLPSALKRPWPPTAAGPASSATAAEATASAATAGHGGGDDARPAEAEKSRQLKWAQEDHLASSAFCVPLAEPKSRIDPIANQNKLAVGALRKQMMQRGLSGRDVSWRHVVVEYDRAHGGGEAAEAILSFTPEANLALRREGEAAVVRPLAEVRAEKERIKAQQGEMTC